MLLLITLLSLSRGALAAETCNPPRRNSEPARYEDFYSIRRRAEARDEEREAAVHEIHGREAERQEKFEAARLEYVRHRRPKPDDAVGEAAWDEQRKERVARIENARKCFVTERDHAEAQAKHGRTIPGDVEFGLNE